MKRKELKQLAEKIAKQEIIIQNSDDPTKVKEAQTKIMELSSHVKELEDIVAVDEIVQQILEKS